MGDRVRAVVVGAGGRMGLRLVAMILENPAFVLAGAVERKDHPGMGRDVGEMAGLGSCRVRLSGDFAEAISAADVAVDFTSAETSLENLKVLAGLRKSAVIGSTGFTAVQMDEVRALTKSVSCVLSPNMSVGVNVMFRVIGDLARILGEDYDLEVVEAHHRMKKDAPSGTAMKMGQILAQARDARLDEVGAFARKGLIGERRRTEIGMQTVRAGDIVGEHTVIFGGMGERLEVTHRAHSRDNFARGALRAALWVVRQKPGLYDMQDVLGMTE
jgi:4-hydroxy-tetrahydrodipicolinate reductase